MAEARAFFDHGRIEARFDFNAPLMCLPRLLGTTLETVPASIPYLAADPATGHGDFKGWTAAYTKYFGTSEQPNKPSRTSVTVVLGNNATKIEIETIAVRKPKT